jgi:hypothetical protein
MDARVTEVRLPETTKEKRRQLERNGFLIGAGDGQYVIIEDYPGTPWCAIGPDLEALIDRAYALHSENWIEYDDGDELPEPEPVRRSRKQSVSYA